MLLLGGQKELIMTYENEFKIFSANIQRASRSFYYDREMQSQVYKDCQRQDNNYFQDSKLYQAMQRNAQFWNDYKYSSILCTIIVLGRVFDKNNSSHSIKRLIKLSKETTSFKKLS